MSPDKIEVRLFSAVNHVVDKLINKNEDSKLNFYVIRAKTKPGVEKTKISQLYELKSPVLKAFLAKTSGITNFLTMSWKLYRLWVQKGLIGVS